MPRPRCPRWIQQPVACTYFKPAGIPVRKLEVSLLEADEVEALHLADGQQLYHQEAATRMGISRQTFDRIVRRARQKVADALVHGKALRIVSAPGAPRSGTDPAGPAA